MTLESSAERLRFATLLAAACALLTLPRLLLHELWRDEAWLWLVAGGSRSLHEMLAPLTRSGQGNLFPLLCFLAARISASPRAMQLLHLALVAAAVFVFARWAPFGRRERALFLLGYFPFYEYAVISRHYVAGVLLLWLACAAARSRRPATGLGAALGLLCQTTFYGYILALAILGGWLLDRRLRRGELPPLPKGDAVEGLLLGVAGAFAGLVQLIPAAGTSFAPTWRFGWAPALAGRVLRMPWNAFLPFPHPGLHFWNTNFLDQQPGFQALGGLLLLALAAVFLRRSPVALATVGIGTAGILVFGYVKLIGEQRHLGHLWLLFVAALWLGGGLGVGEERRSWRARAFLVLLIVHAAAALYASWMDLRHPFSDGAATAAMIQREGWDRFPLLGSREPPAATVALYLGRPLYSPSRKVYAYYPDWGPTQRELSPAEIRCAARGLARREGRDVVLVLNAPPPLWEELTFLGSVTGAIVASEEYHLYRLAYGRLASTDQAAGCGVVIGEAPSSAGPPSSGGLGAPRR